MALVKFPNASDEDIFRCIEFNKRYQNMRDTPPSSGNFPGSSMSTKTMYRIKKTLDLSSYGQFKSQNNIDVIGQLETKLNIRIDIYTTMSTLGRKLIAKKSYESSNSNSKIQINLFNSKFNQFSNPNLKGMALIIDLVIF